jgi:hypothetical protein
MLVTTQEQELLFFSGGWFAEVCVYIQFVNVKTLFGSGSSSANKVSDYKLDDRGSISSRGRTSSSG